MEDGGWSGLHYVRAKHFTNKAMSFQTRMHARACALSVPAPAFLTCQHMPGETISSELIPGGKDMPVTANNVVQYKV